MDIQHIKSTSVQTENLSEAPPPQYKVDIRHPTTDPRCRIARRHPDE